LSRTCIDIGSKYIHIAEGDYQKNQLTVLKSGSSEISGECFDDEMVVNDELLAETIKSLAQREGFSLKEIVITINGTHSIIREVDIPHSKPKDLDDIVKNEMYQTFHILNTDIIQYKRIDRPLDEEDEGLDRYRVAAIDKDFVESYFRTARRLGGKRMSMDLNINAIDKLLDWADTLNETATDEKGFLLIDFGHTITTVYIYSKNQPLFYRHLNIGSSDIDKVLIDTFHREEKEAESFKKDMNFFDEKEDTVPYFEALKPILYHMVDEVRKLATFYINRSKGSSIGKCFLAGQGSNLPGFPQYWSISLGISTEKLQSISRGTTVIPLDNPGHLNAVAGLIRHKK
jgi:type IV pilus assembly protein PilM